jgi:hypothetical protein
LKNTIYSRKIQILERYVSEQEDLNIKKVVGYYVEKGKVIEKDIMFW